MFSALDTLYGTEKIQIQNDLNCKPETLIHSVKLSHENSEEIPQEEIPSIYASNWYDGYKNKDIRPRLIDGLGVSYLLDSGSMTCVWPATKADVVDSTIKLQAVDGTPFDCYGKKKLVIKVIQPVSLLPPQNIIIMMIL